MLILSLIVLNVSAESQNFNSLNIYRIENNSWFQVGGGIAYKGILGVEINGHFNLDVIKLNRGFFRVSINNETGLGTVAAGFGGSVSNTSMITFNFYRGYRKLGYILGLGRDYIHIIGSDSHQKYHGYNMLRLGIYDTNTEYYIHMSYNHEKFIKNLLTLELGVRFYFDIL